MQKITFCPPYIEWLPGAVDTRSWDMVVWFFPAFVALLIVRHSFSRPAMVMTLFQGMVFNASLLAIFGLLVPILSKNYHLWLTPILPQQIRYFFSSFAYPNHAGSYFILHLGLTFGLFSYYINRKEKSRALLKAGLLIVISLLLCYAIHLSRCRYAILYSWLAAAVFLGYLFYLSWKLPGKRRKRRGFAIALVGILVISLFIFNLKAKNDLISKLSAIKKPGKFIAEQFDMKLWQTEAAAKIWRDYPIFGAGGHSYGEYLLQYVKDPKKRHIAVKYKGMANVHNDFMQFLCEFGTVGAGLLLAVFFLLVARVLVSKQRKQGFLLFALLGLIGVLIHSLIDLPFRSPPVIIVFAVVLAGYGDLTGPADVTGRAVCPFVRSFLGLATRVINFHTTLLLLIAFVGWWALFPVRQNVSADIIRAVERKHDSHLVKTGNITPVHSQNSSPQLLRSLWWAKLWNSDNKRLHRLSAEINFDLYRNYRASNPAKARQYLKKAFRSVLALKRFTSFADIGFVKLYAAILDAKGYYLEESWCLMNLRKAHPKDIRVNLLVRELYTGRPYLIQ